MIKLDKWDILTISLIIFLLVLQLIYPYLFSVVMTPSMEHMNFNYQKYLKYNITPEQIEKWPFKDGINVGDVVIIVPVNPEKIKVGDVVLYKSKLTGLPILHRVIEKRYKNGKIYFTVMGDNNPSPNIEERNLPADRIIGKAVFRIPYIGLPKVWLTELWYSITK